MKFTQKSTLLLGYAIGSTTLGRVPLRAIIGSKLGFFSLDQALAPLIGFFSSSSSGFVFYAIRTIIAFFFTASLSNGLLHLPTLAGTLSLSVESRILKALLPAVCIVAFLGHPVGGASWIYTLYWLPPVFIALFGVQSIFLRSLASTLTTHAVGSTLWIYTHQTNVLFWHSLMGIVWLERVTFALCLTAGYYAYAWLARVSGRPCPPKLRKAKAGGPTSPQAGAFPLCTPKDSLPAQTLLWRAYSAMVARCNMSPLAVSNILTQGRGI